MTVSGFYKMDPAAWDFGTANLSLEEEAAYLRIINAINKHDGPVPNVDRVLAGMFRCSTRKARVLRDALLEAGKIYIEDDRIWNDRARFEVYSRSVQSEKRAESGAKGGRVTGERRAKALKDNELVPAGATPRIEENRIEETPQAPQGVDGVLDEFEEWWKHAPRKVGKGAARRAFKAARKKADLATLTAGIRKFALAVHGKDERFICHPSSWLNGERWDDKEGVDVPTTQASDADLLAQRVDRAEGWLQRHDTIAGHMDRPDVAKALLDKGHDYDRLREAGFSLPPRGKVIDLGGHRNGQYACG